MGKNNRRRKKVKTTKANEEVSSSEDKPKKEIQHQTHGMVEEEAKTEPSTLDQIWGDTGLGKYNTLDLSVYEKKLSDMGKSDLQSHANSIGLIPIDDSSMLRQRLVREFRKHVAKYGKPLQSSNEEPAVDPKIQKILSEGR
jgi:hypothetical protein